MTRRYFASSLPEAGGVVALDDMECHHAFNVMRVREGEHVVLFDGRGAEAAATVVTATKRQLLCETAPVSRPLRENKVHLVLGVAMPKGDRAKEMIERLTELGVNELVPLHCERTPWKVPEHALEKWQRLVIDACKQSGRNQLMQIHPPQPLANWFASFDPAQTQCYVAHPATDGEPALSSTTTEDRAAVAIGPEGGFSEGEIEQAVAQGWQRFSLGARIYRIETAAVLATVKLARL